MKNIFKKLKIYFTRLFAALRGKEIEKIVVEKVYGKKRKELDDFDLDHIREIMDKTEIKPTLSEKAVQEGFIKNRKAYNKYKKWYWKLVGFNKPPEEVKVLIEADLKMDRIEMDNLYLDLLDVAEPVKTSPFDNKQIEVSETFTNALKNGHEITPELEDELHKSIERAVEKTKLKPKKDLKKILEQNKENLKRIK